VSGCGAGPGYTGTGRERTASLSADRL